MKKSCVTAVIFLLVGMYTHAQVYANDSLRALGEQSNNQLNFELSIEKKELEQTFNVFPDVSSFYKVTSVEAANFHANHTAEEIFNFQQEAQKEFETYTYFLDLENGRLIRQNRTTLKFKIFNIVANTETIQLVNCETCDQVIFKILEKSDSHLVITDKAQDEGHMFDFIFSFSK